MAELPIISFAPLSQDPRENTLVLFLPEGDAGAERVATLNRDTHGVFNRAMSAAEFKPKRKAILDILAPHGLKHGRLLVVGLGDPASLNERDWMDIGGAVRGKSSGKTVDVDVVFDGRYGASVEGALSFVLGFYLRSYSFKKYKSKASKTKNDDEESSGDVTEPLRLTIRCADHERLSGLWQERHAIAKGVYLARDLVNEPANILNPPEFASRLGALEAAGLTVTVLDEDALKALNMTALLAVGQGSAQPTSAVVMRWEGDANAATPDSNYVFIGKGVCFDTGGISIKPAPGMEDMKGDMAGAAAVAGLMLSLATRRAPVNAIGLVGLVENMPSATAQRPGDIINSASGQTIEVLNTDAEGRLVLADLLWYAQAHLSPKLMITLATLTGAILIALGKENAGLFSNSDDLSAGLTKAGIDTGETVWRMPLSKKYNKMIDSKMADMKNIGGRDAGSITAAQFLQRFVNDGVSWAHLDIAGTAMASPATDINHSWGSGYGVRLLNRFIDNSTDTAVKK